MEYPKYLVYDSETTIKDGNGTAFNHANRVVLSGSVGAGVDTIADGIDPVVLNCMSAGYMIVGQNIAFDLQYIMRDRGPHFVMAAINCGMSLWDTQIAEYVLTGQQSKMVSLDDLARKYGGTLKDSYVSDMFAKGIGADMIEKKVLIPYLEADLKNTELVFKEQYKLAKDKGQLPLIMYMNYARLMTAIMQHYGLRVRVNALASLRRSLEGDSLVYQDDIAAEIVGAINRRLPTGYTLHADKESMCTDSILSSYIFGGTAHVDVKIATGEVYKSGKKAGQAKFKNGTYPITFDKRKEPWLPTKSSKSYTLLHPMDDDVLEALAPSQTIALRAQHLRRNKKLVGTYIDGVLKNTDSLGYVHPEYNHALTATGRLSCSKPNLQNVDSMVKQYYQPHDGYNFFMEFDFKQLEVCGLAQVSGDPQLIYDVSHGVDLHFQTGRVVFGWKTPADMDEKTRRGVKGVNFGLIYGGSAKGLAKQTGFPVKTVEKLIAAFYDRYPRVKEWQEENIQYVKMNRKYTSGGMRTEKGYPRGVCSLHSATGREYVFGEYDAPDWLVERGTYTSFSPTEIKNYPVQGFATGDIVPITLGILLAYWCKENIDCFPVNTVHDSFMFVVKNEEEMHKLYAMVTEQVLPSVVAVLKETFGIELQVPLLVDAKYGYNWGEMDKYKPL